MNLKEIKNAEDPSTLLLNILEKLHIEGPKSPEILEKLSFFKEFHPIEFQEYEDKIISALGLFYKMDSTEDIYSFLMRQFGQQYKEDYGDFLTPVQASVRRALDEHQYVSISAPTSAGKSYSIRDFIAESCGDAVVIVPSRALIAEYVGTMKRKFKNDKNVMITAFVDLVFTSRKDLRRIFILTPERAKDLYKVRDRLNIEVFFLDEAQTSEESKRGIIFDVSVRRIQKNFPASKIIFAHPFVENSEAQLLKHDFPSEQRYARLYTHGSVGKLCIFQHKNNKDFYFSPYDSKGHLQKKCVPFDGSFKDFVTHNKKSVMVYVSKSSIYNGSFEKDFSEYIRELPTIKDEHALRIIDNISEVLGVNQRTHKSVMVALLRKGVVIHHGSIPLEVRFLIEDFIRHGHARLCFATSTLAQGINMPFDVVWLSNNRMEGNEDKRSLDFKNLIGRAGRLSEERKFDYGYVFTENPKLFISRINKPYRLKNVSVLDDPLLREEDEDSSELVDAIQNDTFDDDKNMPLTKIERLSQPVVLQVAKVFLDIIYSDPTDMRASIGGTSNKLRREKARACLQEIYETVLGRDLLSGEMEVFNEAVKILFQILQGRSFREIVGIRYSNISNRDGGEGCRVQFSQPAATLPDQALKNAFPLYGASVLSEEVSYDVVVFDTYDYFDRVISFSLSDAFIAAFKVYEEQSDDTRALKIVDFFRYGTSNPTYVLLIRYGFPPEMVNSISEYVKSVDEEKIHFRDTIASAPEVVRSLVEWYLPEQ